VKELFCACTARSNLYFAKEKLKIVSMRGGAAHFALPHPSRAPRGEGNPEAEQARYGVKIPFELIQEYTERALRSMGVKRIRRIW